MQRWALILFSYQYNIVYCKSEDNANVDTMSRLPSNPSDSDSEGKDDIFKPLSLKNYQLEVKK